MKMEIILYITSFTTVFCMFLYVRTIFQLSKSRKINKKINEDKESEILKLNSNLQNSNSKIRNLNGIVMEKNKIIDYLKNDLKSNKRRGFYRSSTNLIDKEKNPSGDLYEYIIFVKEIEKYKNGMCKIELEKVEMISGLDIANYEHIKNCARHRFCTVKEQNKIEWLELDQTITEQRKEKLKNINNKK